MVELEYKQKSIILEYFIEIGGELVSLLQELGVRESKGSDFLNEHILKLVRSRQHKFKQKLIRWKDQKLYDIVDSVKSFVKPNSFTAFRSRNSIEGIPNLKSSFDLKGSGANFNVSRIKTVDNRRYNDFSNFVDVNTSQNLNASKLGPSMVKDSEVIISLNNMTKETIEKITNFLEEEKFAFDKEETTLKSDKVSRR